MTFEGTNLLPPDDYSIGLERVLGQFAGELLRASLDDVTAVITFVGTKDERGGRIHYTGDPRILMESSITLLGSVLSDLLEGGLLAPAPEPIAALAALMEWAGMNEETADA